MKPLRDEKGRIKSLGYPVRYPYVGNQNFLDQKYRDLNPNKLEYLINGKWVSRNYVPERMKYNNDFSKKFMRSEQGFFQQMGYRNSRRHRSHIKEWSGKLELGKRDSLIKHWHEQQEKYGDKCPITGVTLTMLRVKENRKSTITETNISPDRLFSSITYTKQNVLFTSSLWNMKRGASKFKDLKLIFKEELIARLYKIIQERYPNTVETIFGDITSPKM